MKLVPLLIVIFFACVVNGDIVSDMLQNTQNIFDLRKNDSSKKNDSPPNDFIQNFQNTINKIIEGAVKMIKDNIDGAKEKASELTEQIKRIADGIMNQIDNIVKRVHDEFEKQLQRLAAVEESRGVNVSECMKAATAFRVASVTVISNTSECLTQKIVKSQNLAREIGNKTDTAISAVGNFADQASRCLDGVRDIFGLFFASRCVFDAKIDNGFDVIKQLPGLIGNVVEMVNLLMNLPGSLNSCALSHAAKSVQNEASQVISTFQRCVTENFRG